MDDLITQAKAWVDAAERVVVLTGAGISTDSGIPDFRGPQGLWTKNPAAEKASRIEVYRDDPGVRAARWQQLAYRDEASAREPNAGHEALVVLEQRGKLHTLITQNVDGLHHKAGNDPRRIVEIHGNTREVMCLSCDDRAPVERAIERVRAGEADPACRRCGGILKVATISFGQALLPEDIARAEEAAHSCDLLLAVGSTLSVWPAAAVVPEAKARGVRVVIVNREATEMDDLADIVLRGSISELLPLITAVSRGSARP